MIKDVRQVLMNELGLTRELVQQEIRAIVVEEFKKFLNSKEMQPMLESILFDSKRNDVKWKVIDLAADRLGTELTNRLFKETLK